MHAPTRPLAFAVPALGGLALSLVLPLACKSDPAGQGTGAAGAGQSGSAGTGGTTGEAGSGAGGSTPVADGSPVFSRAELLGAFGACGAATVHAFRMRATALETAAAAYVATPGDAERSAAVDAFKSAMDAWQVAEQMQFGPTATRLVPGGQGFRDEIYGWPSFGRCAIEEALVNKTYEAPDLGPVLLVNRRGLGAIEYLLMYAGSDTVCSATSAAGTGWAALSTDERAARKRAYAAAVARDIAKRAAALDDAWDPAKGNFSQTLRTAGSGNATYPMTQDALNSVSDAVFYVEIKVKDAKLAVPAGIDMDACPSTTCPDELESKFGGLSKANVRANLRGARQLLEGCGADYAGLGFDDLLEAVGAGAVAAQLKERVAAAQAALEAIEEPDLREALAADRDSVLALYQALKGITDVLKSDFATILDLRLPAESMGDND